MRYVYKVLNAGGVLIWILWLVCFVAVNQIRANPNDSRMHALQKIRFHVIPLKPRPKTDSDANVIGMGPPAAP